MAGPTYFEFKEFELACPYFMPVSHLEGGTWPHPARLPLGCGWSGHCTAPGHEGQIPQVEILEAFCNLGYASGCTWAPAERSWDAVRFAVSAPGESGRDKVSCATRVLTLRYVCERGNRPVDHGELQFDLPRAMWIAPHHDARIQKMAECFLETYLKKKS
jgi:hypothetical protein